MSIIGAEDFLEEVQSIIQKVKLLHCLLRDSSERSET